MYLCIGPVTTDCILAICRYPRHWFYDILTCSCSRTRVQSLHVWVRDIQAYNSIILLWQKVSSHYCQSPATGEVKRVCAAKKTSITCSKPFTLLFQNPRRRKKTGWLLDCEHMWFLDHHSCHWMNMITKTTSINCKDPSFTCLLVSVSLLEESFMLN